MFYRECKLCGNYANNLCVVLNKPVEPENACILLSSNFESVHDREVEVLEQIKAAESLLEINRSFLGTLKTMKEKLLNKPVLPMEREKNHFKPGAPIYVVHNGKWIHGTVISSNNNVVEYSTKDGLSVIVMHTPAIVKESEYTYFAQNPDVYQWWYITACVQLQEKKEIREREFNPLKKVR